MISLETIRYNFIIYSPVHNIYKIPNNAKRCLILLIKPFSATDESGETNKHQRQDSFSVVVSGIDCAQNVAGSTFNRGTFFAQHFNVDLRFHSTYLTAHSFKTLLNSS